MHRAPVLLVWLTLAGCASAPIDAYRGSRPLIQPEVFFDGETRAYGYVQDRFGTIRRRFVVDIEGHDDAGTLTLEELLRFDDGERQARIWRVRKTGPDSFEGRAADVVGPALGQRAGQALQWRYDIELPFHGTTVSAHVDALMLQEDERIMIERSLISKLGIQLGEVVTFFARPEVGAAALVPVLAPSLGVDLLVRGRCALCAPPWPGQARRAAGGL